MERRSFGGHALTCECPQCDERTRLHEQHITHDAPTNNLPSRSVSLRELVGVDHTTQPRYSIGEDWSDD